MKEGDETGKREGGVGGEVKQICITSSQHDKCGVDLASSTHRISLLSYNNYYAEQLLPTIYFSTLNLVGLWYFGGRGMRTAFFAIRDGLSQSGCTQLYIQHFMYILMVQRLLKGSCLKTVDVTRKYMYFLCIVVGFSTHALSKQCHTPGMKHTF